jgi:hypothetical protein
MPPALEVNGFERPMSAGENNFWAGLNILKKLRNTRDWAAKHLVRLPKVISTEWLNETDALPEVVAVMRGFARQKKVADRERSISGAADFPLIARIERVGDIYHSEQPDGLTNRVIPIVL